MVIAMAMLIAEAAGSKNVVICRALFATRYDEDNDGWNQRSTRKKLVSPNDGEMNGSFDHRWMITAENYSRPGRVQASVRAGEGKFCWSC